MVCKEMLEVLATQGTPQAVFRSMSWRAKSSYFSQGIARVALVEEWPFYPGPVSPCHINGTRNAVGGVLFFGQLILMQNLFNIGK